MAAVANLALLNDNDGKRGEVVLLAQSFQRLARARGRRGLGLRVTGARRQRDDQREAGK